ncbi:MAG: WG repeat-containing protein [Chlorobiaceae bacterium]
MLTFPFTRYRQAVVLFAFLCSLFGCDKIKDIQQTCLINSGYRIGQMVIKPRFDGAGDFSEGLAPVRIGNVKTGKWGYISR